MERIRSLVLPEPTRIRLPCLSMGGLLAISSNRLRTSPGTQPRARTSPRMRTCPASPALICALPEPFTSSRRSGPLTLRLRSKLAELRGPPAHPAEATASASSAPRTAHPACFALPPPHHSPHVRLTLPIQIIII